MAAHIFCGDVVIKDKLIVSKVAGAEAINLPDAINAVANLTNTYMTLYKTNFTFTPDNGYDNTGLEAHYGAKSEKYDNTWFDTIIFGAIQNPNFSIGFNINDMCASLQNPPYEIIGTIYYNGGECGTIVCNANANGSYNFELDKQYSSARTTSQATVNSNSTVVYSPFEKFVCLASSASNAKATQKVEIRITYDIAVHREKWAIRISSLTLSMPNNPYLFSNGAEIVIGLGTPGYNTQLMDQSATGELTETQNLPSIDGKYIGTYANVDNSSNLYPLIVL